MFKSFAAAIVALVAATFGIPHAQPPTAGPNEPQPTRYALTVINDYIADPVHLVAGTRFEAADGSIFRTEKGITVPGKRSAANGTVAVSVVAEIVGKRPVDRLTLPGLAASPAMYAHVYAVVPTPAAQAASASSTGNSSISSDPTNQSEPADQNTTSDPRTTAPQFPFLSSGGNQIVRDDASTQNQNLPFFQLPFISREEISGLLTQFGRVVSLLPQTSVSREFFIRQTERTQDGVADSLDHYLSLGGGTLSGDLMGTNGTFDALTTGSLTATGALAITGQTSFNSTGTTTFGGPIGSAAGNFILSSAGSGNNLLLNPYGGSVGIGTTTPGSLFAINGLANFTAATSTFLGAGGINLTGGCFAVGGTCIGGSSSQWTTSGSNIYYNTGNVGIGTTSPYAKLSVVGPVVAEYFHATSTTATSTFSGNLTVGTSLLLGTSTLNTNMYNYIFNTIDGSYSLGSKPFSGSFDARSTYSGPAPTVGTLTGPSFYLTVSPSTDVDQHDAIYNGISGTVYSASATVLGQMVGGNFSAIRVSTSGGSTNPIFGVLGNAVMGDKASGVANGDGAVGGMFTATVNSQAATNPFDPLRIQGQAGVVGRVIVKNNYLSTRDSIGVAGYVNVESGANNVYGGWFSADSRASTMALAGNVYGIYVKDIAGAKNLNMALRTGLGTVQFGGNVVASQNMIGDMKIIPIGTPSISTVSTGCTGEFSCAGGGSKTYSYKVVAVFASGKTSAASAQVSTAAGFDNLAVSGQNNRIMWTPVEGAVGGYNIYRTVAGGATTNTTGLIANVAQNIVQEINSNTLTPTLPSYIDSGAAGDGSSPPSTNTTGNFEVSAGRVGIGTTTPWGKLAVSLDSGETNVNAFIIASSTAVATTTLLVVSNDGNATLAGTLTQNSDARLKSNIQPLAASSSLAAVAALSPVSYGWTGNIFGQREQLGFIAQDVQKLFPQLVSTTSPTALTPGGTLSLNYSGLIAPIVSAIKEIASISGAFKAALVTWLADAANGIGALFAREGHFSDQLCVGTTCVTPQQFKTMVAAAGQSVPASPPGQGSAASTTSSSGPESGIAIAAAEPPMIANSTTTPTTTDPTTTPAQTTEEEAPTTGAVETSPTVETATEETAAASETPSSDQDPATEATPAPAP